MAAAVVVILMSRALRVTGSNPNMVPGAVHVQGKAWDCPGQGCREKQVSAKVMSWRPPSHSSGAPRALCYLGRPNAV